MKEYKLESLVFYERLTFNLEKTLNLSTIAIQDKLDEYAKNGWRLASTGTTNLGAAMYIYLYFERDI